jgi:hypothetical protein
MTFMNVPREETSKGHYTGTHLHRDDERFGIRGAMSEEGAINMQDRGDKPPDGDGHPREKGV